MSNVALCVTTYKIYRCDMLARAPIIVSNYIATVVLGFRCPELNVLKMFLSSRGDFSLSFDTLSRCYFLPNESSTSWLGLKTVESQILRAFGRGSYQISQLWFVVTAARLRRSENHLSSTPIIVNLPAPSAPFYEKSVDTFTTFLSGAISHKSKKAKFWPLIASTPKTSRCWSRYKVHWEIFNTN